MILRHTLMLSSIKVFILILNKNCFNSRSDGDSHTENAAIGDPKLYEWIKDGGQGR